MNEVYITCMVVEFIDGQRVKLLRDVFEDKEDAQRKIHEYDSANRALLPCLLVQMRTEEEADEIGMSLADYMESVGIRAIEHVVLRRQSKAGPVWHPKQGLIIPGGRA